MTQSKMAIAKRIDSNIDARKIKAYWLAENKLNSGGSEALTQARPLAQTIACH